MRIILVRVKFRINENKCNNFVLKVTNHLVYVSILHLLYDREVRHSHLSGVVQNLRKIVCCLKESRLSI